jgi:ATP-binding cassette subfamily F protein 3
VLGGTVTEGKGLAIGYFAQHEMDLLAEDDTPLQRMVRLAREVSPQAREQELRNFLGQFRFEGDMVHQTVGTLSGGERARLVLATIVWQRPNLLLLDEPTNHLDLDTREALSMALNEFEGTVMLVSHDRALLREVCDEFWLVSRGGVAPFDGDLDDYQRWLLDVARAVARGQDAATVPLPGTAASTAPPAAAPAAARAPARTPAPAPATPAPATGAPPQTTAAARGSRDDRKADKQARTALAQKTRPLRVELQRLDERLARLGAEKAEVEARLAASDTPPDAFAELGRRLAHIGAETAVHEERWLEIQGQLDAMDKAA